MMAKYIFARGEDCPLCGFHHGPGVETYVRDNKTQCVSCEHWSQYFVTRTLSTPGDLDPQPVDEWLRAAVDAEPKRVAYDAAALGMPTGNDWRVLHAIGACWTVYAAGDDAARAAALQAVRELLTAMQPKCWLFAKELIAWAMDWSDRSRIWDLIMSEMPRDAAEDLRKVREHVQGRPTSELAPLVTELFKQPNMDHVHALNLFLMTLNIGSLEGLRTCIATIMVFAHVRARAPISIPPKNTIEATQIVLELLSSSNEAKEAWAEVAFLDCAVCKHPRAIHRPFGVHMHACAACDCTSSGDNR